MLKRILSLILVVTVSVICFSACGKSSGGKVTLTWAMLPSYYNQKNTADVLEVFNKKLQKEMPGVTIKFKELVADNWTQWMAAGEEIDIAWTGYQFDMSSEIANGSYLELEDYIDEKTTPNIYKEWQDYKFAYDTATVNDHLYAIPNQQPIIKESPVLRIPAELVDSFDIAAFKNAVNASAVTTEDVYKVLDKFFETVYSKDLIDTDYVGKSIDPESLYECLARRGYDFVDNSSNVCYSAFDKDPKLVNFLETDAYKLWCNYASKWFEKGYISSNILVNGGGAGNRLPVLAAHSSGNWYNTDENGMKPINDEFGDVSYYTLCINPKDLSQNFNGITVIGSEATYTCVPFTTKHAKEAVQLLDLLRSEEGTAGNELFNLLVYGFEKNSEEAKEYGKYHYTLDGDLIQSDEYSVMPTSETTYGIPHWVVGNVYLAYRTSDILEGQKEYAYEYVSERSKTAYQTKYCGLKIDITSIAKQRSNVSSVTEEFNNRLYCGVEGANYLTLYKQFIDKLRTAGSEEIVKELSSQASAYQAK